MNNITVLDHLLVVNLEVRIWTARKKLSPTDLGDAQLPPEDLASLGSKRVCNPDDLKMFGTLKSRATSLLDRHGVRFLSGWAIPENKAQPILDELTSIRDEFNFTKHNFLASYDQSVNDWIAMHPQWGAIIAGSTVSKQHVSGRISFNWQMFKVVAPYGQVGTELHACADNLGLTLFEEISKAASEAWVKCFADKSEITRKALSPLKTMQEKLHGLSFLEPRVMPVVELINAAMASIPRRGAITGSLLTMLQGLVCLMQNPQALMQHGQMLLDGQQANNDVLDGFLQATPQPSAVAKEADKEDSPVSLQPSSTLESCGLW